MKKLVIGLTGGMASGKSTVAKLFENRGIKTIDTDQLARELTQPGQNALIRICDYFGTAVLLPNGHLNRSLLREIVFKDAQKRIWLEKLLHPLIREAISHAVAQSTTPYCIVVIPLLFETQPNPLIQRILVVDSDESAQRERAAIRDQCDPSTLEAIFSAQVSREARLSRADDIIRNHGSIVDLDRQVETLHQFYLSEKTHAGTHTSSGTKNQ